MKKIYTFILLLFCAWHDNLFAHENSFAENKGQWNKAALFRIEIPGGALFITKNGPVYHFAHEGDLQKVHDRSIPHRTLPSADSVRMHAYRFNFIGANDATKHVPSDKTNYYENFFIGNDPKNWADQVRHFRQIKQENIFKNIDLIYRTKQNSIKYDFIVKPGADPASIKMALEGADAHINAKQQLEIRTSVKTIIEAAPFSYQVIAGDTIVINSAYVLNGNVVSFELGAYNKAYPLIIDPDLIFATYSGANASNFYSQTSSYDHLGNTIIAARGFGAGWPTQMGAYSTTHSGLLDVALMKLSGDGTQRIFATYLGGALEDIPVSITTSDKNYIYLSGYTSSSDFPTTLSALQTTYGGGTYDIFLAKLDLAGTQLMASTYLGGNDTEGVEILTGAIGSSNKSPTVLRFNDHDKSLWLTSSSQSSNFPTTPNAIAHANAISRAVLVQLDSNLSQITYSTFFHYNNNTHFHDLKVSRSNFIYLCGNTEATNVGTPNAFLNTHQGGYDGMVLKLDPGSRSILASSYLGTATDDNATKISISELEHNVYIAGNCSGNYAITPNTWSVPNSRNYVQVLDSNLSTGIAACSFGNNTPLEISDININSCSGLAIAGMHTNTTFPITPDAYATSGEFWMGTLETDLSGLIYGTYFGYGGHTHAGTFQFDDMGNIHHSVCDIGGSFVTSTGAWSPTKLTNGYDMVSFRFDIYSINLNLEFELAPGSNDTGCLPHEIHFINNSSNYTEYLWDFGNGQTSDQYHTSVNYTQPGVYKVLLKGYNEICNAEDRDSLYIVVKNTGGLAPLVADTTICYDSPPIVVQVKGLSNDPLLDNYTVTWEPASAIGFVFDPLRAEVLHRNTNVIDIHFEGILNDSICLSDTTIKVHINYFDSAQVKVTPNEATICSGDSLMVVASGGIHYKWAPTSDLMLSSMDTAFLHPVKSTNYLVTITDTHQCNYYKNVSMTVLEKDKVDAGPDVTVKIGETAQLKGSTNAGVFYWQYEGIEDFHNQERPFFLPSKDSTLLYLISVNPNGCSNFDSTYVFQNDYRVANAFTPNGDGLNDVFYPVPKNEHAELKNFSVYNRYGQVIFQTTRLGVGWDGTYKDQPADLGVYYFIVEFKIGEKVYKTKGDVTLIR